MTAPLFRPSKIVAIGRNYADHAKELGNEVPKEPLVFLKAPSAIVGNGDAIVIPPPWAGRIEYEGELAVVIGKRAKGVSEAEAMNFVSGYTCANDVTARELQKSDGQWSRAKGFDTFCPLGPRIVSTLDPSNLKIQTRVNGQVRQSASTADLIFKIPRLIAHVTACMTLEEGDLILTGTPAGVGPIVKGDTVEVEIEGIGILSNPVQ